MDPKLLSKATRATKAILNGITSPDAETIAATARQHLSGQQALSPEFPLKAFPKALHDIVKCWSDCYLLPADYYAASILAAASGVIGNAYLVEYKIHQSEPAIVWVAIVGAPGIGKTPAIKFALGPLLREEQRFHKDHRQAVDEWEQEKKESAKNKKKQPPGARPCRRQRIINDTTIEALIKVHPANPRGLLSYRDELVAWFKSMNAYKSGGSDLETWLSIWSNSTIILNRVSNEDPIFIHSPFVSAVGGIQPGVLQTLTDNNKVDNGFVSRILFAYPDSQDIPAESDIVPDQSVFEHYRQIIANLSLLPVKDDDSPLTLKLSDKAKACYREQREKMRHISNNSDDENILSLHVKMLTYTLRFSLILELLEVACNEELLSVRDMEQRTVSLTSMRRAIELADYFTATALRVLLRFESPVHTLNPRNKALYEALPFTVRTDMALAVGEKLGISASTVKRLIYNKNFFRQSPDGSYQKKFN